MTDYSNGQRGLFQHSDMAKQLVSFEGLVFQGENGKNNVTPTDIDGLVQLDKENCFIFFELKHHDNCPLGQKKALERLADCISTKHKEEKYDSECVVFIANHNTPKDKTIIAKNSIVVEFYYHGKWFPDGKRTLGEISRDFINILSNKEDKQK